MYKIKSKETFTQSILALMLSQIVIKILGLFFRLYLTNRNGFGDEGNAIANGGFQVFALVLSIIAIGIPTAISKLIAQIMARGDYRGAYKIFKVALFFFATIGIIGSYSLFKFSSFLANNYLHIKETRLSIIALCPSVFLVSIISVYKGYFNGRKTIKQTATAQSLDQLTKTFSTIIMIEFTICNLKNTNTELMAAISNLGTTFGNIVELAFLYKAYRKELPNIRREIENSINMQSIGIKEIIKQILIVAIPISLTAIISTISKNIDSVTIVNNLKDLIGYNEAKKQYGILSGKVDALINFPLSFNMAIVTALLPTIASSNGKIKEQENRINQSMMLGMVIAVPITFLFYAFSSEILGLLFPNAPEGGNILKVSSISIIFITIEQIANIILNGIGKNFIPIKSITIGVITKAFLNRILVPKIYLPFGGTVGAAIATLMCHILASTISTVELKKNTNIKISTKSIVYPTIASIVMIILSKTMFNFLKKIVEIKISLGISLVLGITIFLILINAITPIKILKFKIKNK